MCQNDKIEYYCTIITRTAHPLQNYPAVMASTANTQQTGLKQANKRVQDWIDAGNVETLLYLSHLGLRELPKLPNNLKGLICEFNHLTVIRDLPSSLIWLYCGSNNITIIDIISNCLELINCDNNPITVLPVIPETLMHLSCINTQIITIPAIPVALTHIYCHNNILLTELPIIPDTVLVLNCMNNFDLIAPPYYIAMHGEVEEIRQWQAENLPPAIKFAGKK